MLRTIFWVTWLMFYFIGRLPAYWKAKTHYKRGELAATQEIVDYQVGKWATLILKKIKVHVIAEGKENLPQDDQPVVFASNHQSYIDIPLVLSALSSPHPLLAKASLGKIPFLGAWIKLLRCVLVDRNDMRSGMEAMRDCGELLKSGSSVIIFPEGTRSKTSSNMGEMKEGTIRIATRAKVNIIPIALDGTYKVLEGSNYKLKKATVRIKFLPAISTNGISREEQKALPAKLTKVIGDEVEKLAKLNGNL